MIYLPTIIQNSAGSASAVLFKTRTPAKITSVIPQAGLLSPVPGTDIANVLVNFTHENMRVLCNLKFKDVPSPMRVNYTYPGMFTPYSHQRVTSEFLSLHKRAFCLNDVGTGKTSSALWAADYLMNEGIIKRALVICPFSTMRAAWVDEVCKTVIHRTVDVAHGTRAERKKVIQGKTDFVVINHDGVKLMTQELIDAQFDLIIYDEFTGVKSSQSDRWKATHALILPTTWAWLMSGTPVPQRPTDAYGPLKLIVPENCPRYFTGWKEATMKKINQFKWIPKLDAPAIIHAAMQPAIRFEKKDCIDLPPVTYEVRDVEMTAQQQKYYNKLREEMVIELKGANITAVNAAALLTKLLQVAAGAAIGSDDTRVHFDISSRLKVIRELIEEASGKVLIAVPYLAAMHRLADELKKDYSLELIYGDVSERKRYDTFTRFQNSPDPELLIIQPAAAAHGVTLTEADTIIWYSPTTRFEIYEQFNARINRPGQVRKMTVHLLQSCAAERQLNTALRVMGGQHLDLMDLYKRVVA